MSSKHPDDRRARQARRWRQSGSVTITVAIAFSTLLILLIGTELGYLFYQKRELQKAADLAALAAAQAVDPTSCDGARDAAKANANGSGEGDPLRNLPKGFTLSDEHIVCGH
ncbi:MAG: pilus assembly protein TadG-related protein, partial [Hydrogenophaga sp.]|nr:pilus assembly protein TadG-related protein [Hydrogenophaga sp.]